VRALIRFIIMCCVPTIPSSVVITPIRGVILLEEGILLEALLAVSHTIVLLEAPTKFSSL
jgi:hypothetical protein